MIERVRAKLRRVRKAVIAFGGAATQVANFTVPEYSGEVQFAVGLVVAVLTTLITFRVPNEQ